YAIGYVEGGDAARAEMTALAERDRALLESLTQALQSNDRIDREAVARRLRETVLFLVTRLVGDVGISSERLAQRIEAAADLLTDATESAM
ncbi:hypothetical protein ACEV7R_23320, partial [Vibrio parahaemolyticus]